MVTGGSGNMQITLASAGTYLITGGIVSNYSVATFSSNQTETFNFQRVNNTPAALAGGSIALTLNTVTTYTGSGPSCAMPGIIYTASAGDIIKIYGVLSASPSAGSVTVSAGTYLSAQRLY
jgi:hypothetical protein